MKTKISPEEETSKIPQYVVPERDPLDYMSDPRYAQALEVPKALGLLESAKSIEDIGPAITILRRVAERELRTIQWLESRVATDIDSITAGKHVDVRQQGMRIRITNVEAPRGK